MGVFAQPTELASIRRSGTILTQALTQVVRAAAPGRTTADLDRVAAQAIRQAGATPAFLGYQGFPKTLCVSINDEVVHGIPSERRHLADGDIVGLDLGVVVDGFYTDAACSVAVGTVSAAARHLLVATREALRRAVALVRPGVRTGDLGAAIQAYVEGERLGVVRDLVGHGIGRQLHEDPKLPNFGPAGHGVPLRAGMLVAIEPMVTRGDFRVTIDKDGWTVRTKDYSLAAHFEQTILVTDDGAEVITPYGKDLEP